jgi:hypothetical protein
MDSKLTINLPKPMPATDHCLPHAAMALGSIRGASVRPVRALVGRLVIQQQLDGWVLYRLDPHGGFVGDSWHPTRDDAVREAKNEFGITID